MTRPLIQAGLAASTMWTTDILCIVITFSRHLHSHRDLELGTGAFSPAIGLKKQVAKMDVLVH